MKLLKTIFIFEWRQLCRQRWLLTGLCLFVAISLLSVYSGNRTVGKRFVQADSIHAAYQTDLDAALKRLTDTSTAKGKAEARTAGMAAVINFRLPQNAVKYPEPLAALSLGLTDIQPWHEQIRYVKNYNDATNMPVNNPMTLFSGNFDLAFMIIYFLPLLVLAYCYSLYASEKEAGTLAMLAIQAGSVARVIRLKLLFRFLALAALLLIINALGFALAEKRAAPGIPQMLLWCLLSLLYLLFWLGIAYLIVAFRQGATATGLYLAGCWMLMLVILPSLANTFVQQRHPLPMKDGIAAFRRHQAEEIWNTPARILSDSFNRYNPQHASTADPAKDTLRLSTRYVAGYYELLDRRMQRVTIPYEQEINERNRRLTLLSAWNPASAAQEWLNTLAGTELSAYHQFSRQADQFQESWQAFLYDFHIPGKQLQAADFGRFPVFRYHPPELPVHRMLYEVLRLLVGLCVLFAAGSFVFNRKDQAS